MMKTSLFACMACALLLTGLFGGCSSDSAPSDSPEADSLALADSLATDSLTADSISMLLPDTLERFFTKYGVTGAFMLFDPQTGKYYYHNKARTEEPQLPASTFKIYHALIALETGALPDPKMVLPWDGQTREVENWNQDQTLSSALQYSTVWFFQEMARRIGAKRMQHYLNLINYGNRDIGGGIDQFWLDGDLRISMAEQVHLLRAFYREELPFSSGNIKLVKEALNYPLADTTRTMMAKTGWATAPDPDIGWFVGYVIVHPSDAEGRPISPKGYYFATLIDLQTSEQAPIRAQVTLDLLRHLRVL